MRKFDSFLLGLVALISINAAFAGDGFKPEVNSLVEEAQARPGFHCVSHCDAQAQAFQAYANELEKRVAKLEDKASKELSVLLGYNKRLNEIERILSGKDGKGGLQKQVTILHSKKADK